MAKDVLPSDRCMETIGFLDIAERQGWSDVSRIVVLLDFIRSRDMIDDLFVYVERCAFEENQG